MNLKNIEEPLNSDERYLHGINVRLNILIEMFSSFLDVYAENNKIATSSNKVVEVVEEVPGQVVLDMEGYSKVDYSEFTKKEIMNKLDEKNVEYNIRSNKDTLVELAKEKL